MRELPDEVGQVTDAVVAGVQETIHLLQVCYGFRQCCEMIVADVQRTQFFQQAHTVWKCSELIVAHVQESKLLQLADLIGQSGELLLVQVQFCTCLLVLQRGIYGCKY